MKNKLGNSTLLVVFLSVLVTVMSVVPTPVYAANTAGVMNRFSFSAVFNPFSSLIKLTRGGSSTNKSTSSGTSSNNDKATVTSFTSGTNHTGATISKTNIIYKNTSSKKCVYDVKYVDDGQLKPVIVTVHGGSWQSGNKSSMKAVVDYFVPLGYVVANVEYEMLDKGNYITGQIEEVFAAVKAIAAAAPEYQGDPERMVIAGVSSGAQIAVRVAQLAADDSYSFKIKAILDFCGICDLSQMRVANRYSYKIDGRRNVSFANEVKKVDPVRFITASMPPVLIMHSKSDRTVSISNAESFYKALVRGGVETEIFKTSGVGHGIFMNRYGTVAKAFLEKYV